MCSSYRDLSAHSGGFVGLVLPLSICADDGIDLKWEFDEERGRYYVSFPDDQ